MVHKVGKVDKDKDKVVMDKNKVDKIDEADKVKDMVGKVTYVDKDKVDKVKFLVPSLGHIYNCVLFENSVFPSILLIVLLKDRFFPSKLGNSLLHRENL